MSDRPESEKAPRITIGIMTHNYGRFIKDAIDSVLRQSVANWELIISDDASTDGTAEIVKPYLTDTRIRYVRHDDNLGQAGNWGFLLLSGTAPVVAVLHADDWWQDNTAEELLAAFDSEPAVDLVCGEWWRYYVATGKCVVPSRKIAHSLSGELELLRQAAEFTCLVSASAVRRTLVERAGLPDKSLSHTVDYHYFLTLCAHARKVASISHPLTMYRVHDSSVTANGYKSGRWIDEEEVFADICDPLFAKTPGTIKGTAILRAQMARCVFSIGVSTGVGGDVVLGRAIMDRAIRVDPGIKRNPRFAIDRLLCSSARLPNALFRLMHRKRRS
ncbi:MAG: glycosyltransferase [Capsulimonadaceae bacterium]|nr:glycosyltransferase [Capsulimonadaceae bacterium]